MEIIPRTKQITVKLSIEDAEKLYQTAKKNNLSVSQQLRRFIAKGISVDAYQEDEAKILNNMQTALKAVLDPQIERIAKISVKNSIASSVNLLLTSMLLYRFCSPASRPKLDEFMDEARIMGIRFVQLGKGSVEGFLQSSMEKLNAMWDD